MRAWRRGARVPPLQLDVRGWGTRQFLPLGIGPAQLLQTLAVHWPQEGWDVGALGFHGPDCSFGPELFFGTALAEAGPEDRLELIKHAFGGSRLVNASWSKEMPSSLMEAWAPGNWRERERNERNRARPFPPTRIFDSVVELFDRRCGSRFFRFAILFRTSGRSSAIRLTC